MHMNFSNKYQRTIRSPEDDQSLLIEMSSCTPQFFLELITTQLRFYMVSPQLSLLKYQKERLFVELLFAVCLKLE